MRAVAILLGFASIVCAACAIFADPDTAPLTCSTSTCPPPQFECRRGGCELTHYGAPRPKDGGP